MIFFWEHVFFEGCEEVTINSPLDNLYLHGKRPSSVEFTKQELKWLANNPDYIHKVVGAMRDADPV